MPANSWQKINVNTFQSVWTPVAQRPTTASPYSNISAWSGATWDKSRGNLLIWGGDIGNEEGNEVYSFNVKTGLWSRGSLPSQITSSISPTGSTIKHTVDGIMNAPLSGESWDNVVFLDHLDRMAVIGVSREGKTWRDPSTGRYTGPYFWDPSKADPTKVSGVTGSQVNPTAFPEVLGGQMWQNRNKPMSTSLNPLHGTSDTINVGGIDVVYMTDEYSNLRRYTARDLNPANDTWQLVGQRPISGASGWGAAAIDPINNMYLMTMTKTSFAYWDLDRPGLPSSNRALQIFPIVEAGVTLPDFRKFGVEFDPILRAYVLWDGSSSIWLLTPPSDLDLNDDGILDVTKGWRLDKVGDVAGIGPRIPVNYTGVYGKWVYMDEYSAYLGVIDPFAGDVFVYKPLYQPLLELAAMARSARVVPEADMTGVLLIGLLWMLASSRNRRPRITPVGVGRLH